MTKVHRPLIHVAQATLASLQSTVRKCLERIPRLKQYACLWKDDQAQRLEAKSIELAGLMSERTFLQRQLAGVPAKARLTRMSDEARLREVERRLQVLGGE